MTTTTTETDLWICSEPHASAAGVCVRDLIVRSDDPRFIAAPQFFQPSATPDAERHHPVQTHLDQVEQAARDAQARSESEFQDAAAANVVTLNAAPQKILRAVTNIVCHVDGVPTTIAKGSTILAGDSLAAEHPDAFVPARR